MTAILIRSAIFICAVCGFLILVLALAAHARDWRPARCDAHYCPKRYWAPTWQRDPYWVFMRWRQGRVSDYGRSVEAILER